MHEHDCKYIVQLAYAGRERIIGGFGTRRARGDRRARADERLPVRAPDRPRRSASSSAGSRRRAPRSVRRARRRRARRRERHPLHAVPEPGDQRRARTTTAARSRTAPASRSRSSARSAPRSATTSASASRSASTTAPHELLPWLRRGNGVEDVGPGLLVARGGRGRLHPRERRHRLPASAQPGLAGFPARDVVKTYDMLLSSGWQAVRNYLVFRTWPLSAVFRWWWERPGRRLGIEGINLPRIAAVKQEVSDPGALHGRLPDGLRDRGRDRARRLRRRHDRAPAGREPRPRPAVRAGHDSPPRPCTYCNKCLFNFIENPLGCYDESRFDSREEMVRQILSVYEPAGRSGGRAVEAA